MSNAKSRYWKEVGWEEYESSEDARVMDGHFYNPQIYLRPLPPDAVVISGEDIRGLIDLAVRLKVELEYVNGRSKEDRLQPSINATNVIISILNRTQQNEEK